MIPFLQNDVLQVRITQTGGDELSDQMSFQQTDFFKWKFLCAPEPALPQCGDTTVVTVGSAQLIPRTVTNYTLQKLPSPGAEILPSPKARAKCVCWLFDWFLIYFFE